MWLAWAASKQHLGQAPAAAHSARRPPAPCRRSPVAAHTAVRAPTAAYAVAVMRPCLAELPGEPQRAGAPPRADYQPGEVAAARSRVPWLLLVPVERHGAEGALTGGA